jgi:hypothetical protein
VEIAEALNNTLNDPELIVAFTKGNIFNGL